MANNREMKLLTYQPMTGTFIGFDAGHEPGMSLFMFRQQFLVKVADSYGLSYAQMSARIDPPLPSGKILTLLIAAGHGDAEGKSGMGRKIKRARRLYRQSHGGGVSMLYIHSQYWAALTRRRRTLYMEGLTPIIGPLLSTELWRNINLGEPYVPKGWKGPGHG